VNLFGRKGGHPNELSIPADAASDPQGYEMFRIWVANGKEHCSTRGGQFEDAGSWGIILADLAQHMADAFSNESGQPRDAVVQRIKAVFVNELN